MKRRKNKETKTTRIYSRFWFFFLLKKKIPFAIYKKKNTANKTKDKMAGKTSSFLPHDPQFFPPPDWL